MSTALQRRQKLVEADVPNILEAAADVLETGPRCRGRYVKGDAVCAWGAIYKAVGALPEHGEIGAGGDVIGWDQRKVTRLAALIPSDLALDIVEANDSYRDKRKVIRLLRRAARNLRKAMA